MRKIQLYSEPFSKTGNIAAEGFKRLLGRPTLGLMQTLVREAIQNILDASQAPSGPAISIRLRTLDSEQKRILRERVFSDRPDSGASHAISSTLSKSVIRVLEFCDFGTEGLSGPTRADAAHEGQESLNFVNFLRNVGSVQGSANSGGTYGYGKSSLYAISNCATIIVDSQTQFEGRAERRFMACHLGVEFDAGEGQKRRRFTGRHWWGLLDGSDYVEPLVDKDAGDISAALGMADRTEHQKGTSILILDPTLSEDEWSVAASHIIEAVLWNFWPRMVSTTPASRKLKVNVEVEGSPQHVPNPEDFPPLNLFSSALNALQQDAEEVKTIWCERPRRALGKLSIQRNLRADRVGAALVENSIIPETANHIALMRPFGLVVKYLEGTALPDSRFEWGGVFVCSEEEIVEQAFSTSEPPAHDDWIPENLPKGHQKTFVNVALRNLKEIARPHTSVPLNVTTTGGEKTSSLAATASKLGMFLGDVSSKGPGKAKRKSPSSAVRKSKRITQPQFDGLMLSAQGNPVARFVAELHNDGNDTSLEVVAEPYLVADGGQIDAADLPASYVLRIESIALGDALSSTSGPSLHVGDREGQLVIYTSTLPDAAVGLKLHLRSGRSI